MKHLIHAYACRFHVMTNVDPMDAHDQEMLDLAGKAIIKENVSHGRPRKWAAVPAIKVVLQPQ